MYARTISGRVSVATILGILLVCTNIIYSGDASADYLPTHKTTHLLDIKGANSEPLSLPTDVAIYRDKLYVVDSGNHRVRVFSTDGKAVSSFGQRGAGDGELNKPIGIDVDNKGRIYIADAGNNRIQIFSQDEKYLGGFTVTRDGKLIRPVDICVSEAEQLLYVSGNNSHSIMAFSITGELLHSWGKEGVATGEFRYPATLALLSDHRLAVVDVLNTRVQLFSPKGTYTKSVGEWGVLPGQLFRPKGVAVDQGNHIYISDSYMNLVQVFTETGKFIGVLGDDGTPQTLKTPTGMTVDDKNRLFVTEMRANKISVWQVAPFEEITE